MGQFKHRLMHGQCLQKDSKGTISKGKHLQGLMLGSQLFINEDKSSDYGQIFESKKNGLGVQMKNGTTYIGQWSDGCKVGLGKETYRSGESYKGQFDQCPNGFG